MTFIRLVRWRDGEPIEVEASAIVCLSTITPQPPRFTAEEIARGPATVLNLGTGTYSEWVAQAPAEIKAAVHAAWVEQPPRGAGGYRVEHVASVGDVVLTGEITAGDAP